MHQGFPHRNVGAYAPARDQITVACLGDSNTKSGYPQKLQDVLNRKPASARADVRWNVLNFGVDGATADTVTSMAYAKMPEFQQALASRADVVAINLGTNDSHEVKWSEARFTQGIELVVRQLQAAQTPAPAIWLVLPPPLLHNNHMLTERMKMEVPNKLLPRIIRRLATQLGVKVIDGFSPLGGAALSRPDAFGSDGCHINITGRQILAEAVAAAICDSIFPELQAVGDFFESESESESESEAAPCAGDGKATEKGAEAKPPPLTVAPPKTVRAQPCSELSDFDDSDSADEEDLFHNVTEKVLRASQKTTSKDDDVCGPDCCIS